MTSLIATPALLRSSRVAFNARVRLRVEGFAQLAAREGIAALANCGTGSESRKDGLHQAWRRSTRACSEERFSSDRPLRRERHGDGPGLLDVSWSSNHALLHIEPPPIDHAPVEFRVDPPRARNLPPGLLLTGEALLWPIGRSRAGRCGEGDG
jgi:hypothetical protein